MTIEPVPYQDPAQNTLYPSHKTSAYSLSWWTNSYVSQIPEESMGWLMAQGWQVSSVEYDDTTTPPTPYYTMFRQSIQNWYMLQSLLNEYTNAYNAALDFNTVRYNDVISSWSTMLQTSETQFTEEADTQNAHVTLYLNTLDSLLSTVETELTSQAAAVANDKAAIESALSAILVDLAKFEVNYTAHAATIASLISGQSANLTTFLAAHATGIALLTSDFATHLSAVRTIETALDADKTSHIAAFQAQLDLLLPDFTTHQTTATGYLTGLGTTELARINEIYNARLSQVQQELVNRGLYSSNLLNADQERVERERSQAISELNDRLAREKLANEHQLYDQQTALRARTMEGLSIIQGVRDAIYRLKLDNETRLHSERSQTRIVSAEGIDRRHSAQQTVTQEQIGEYERLLADQQGAVGQAMQGRGGHADARLRTSDFSLSNRQRIIQQRMNVNVARLEGLDRVHQGNMQLLAYQLNARNNLLIGLYGFVERREDKFPDFQNLVQLATGLGDAGGGWVSP